MNRNLILSFVFSIICVSVNAQSQVENLLNDVAKYNAAFLDKDFEKVVNMTIPSVVEKAGGTELMTKISIEEGKTIVNSGVYIEKLTPEKPGKIMIAGEDLHAILPQVVTLTVGKTIVKKQAYYLASSSDDGKTWTFLDLEPYDIDSIKDFVPSFTGEIEIPFVEFLSEEK